MVAKLADRLTTNASALQVALISRELVAIATARFTSTIAVA